MGGWHPSPPAQKISSPKNIIFTFSCRSYIIFQSVNLSVLSKPTSKLFYNYYFVEIKQYKTFKWLYDFLKGDYFHIKNAEWTNYKDNNIHKSKAFKR